MDARRTESSTAAFVGDWELESFTETLRDGSTIQPMGEHPQGFLLYTKDGLVSAQLSGFGTGSHNTCCNGAVGTDLTQQISASYIGYCGNFTVDAELQEVIHIPTVAHDRKLIGTALHRKFKFIADRLTLKTSNTEIEGGVVEVRLTWRRHCHV